MRFTRATHRFAAWLAMLAMALGALAPTLAQAVVAVQGGPDWVQVCSASGMRWVQTDAPSDHASGGDADESLADAPRHCPWCQLQGVGGLPPSPPRFMGLAATTAPPLWLARADEPATFWPAAPSRAPPPV